MTFCPPPANIFVMRNFALRLSIVATILVAAPLFAAGRANHVVVVVWDGMRPDFISAEHTPALAQLAREGVFFANHHSVYCSATDVNGAAIATGAYPAHSGIIGNNEFRPDINPLMPVITAVPEVIRKGDKVSHGHFLLRPTVAEILQAAGKTTAIAGTKTVALLHDRRERAADSPSVVVFEGKVLPATRLAAITNQLGAFPKPPTNNQPHTARNEWTRRALTKVLWSNGVPAYSLLWLSEPDVSQHATGPGSPRALAAIEGSDQQLAAVLAELDKRKLRDQTDVFVVSDHGFSTIDKSADVAAVLRAAGFRARREFAARPKPGDILVVGQGGSVFFYVTGHDADVTQRLVKFLQQQDFSGVLFARKKAAGTFPLAAAHLDSSNPPDVILSLHWSPDKSANGTPGLYFCDGGVKGAGSHASFSRFDIHNTLVAAGPDFKSGFTNELPSANSDLAPTVLQLLGVKPKQPMDGRVLSEALTIPSPNVGQPTAERLEATTTNGAVVWKQYLQTSRVNDTVYLDEGNGSAMNRPSERRLQAAATDKTTLLPPEGGVPIFSQTEIEGSGDTPAR